MHIFCVLRWSGIRWNAFGMVRIISLHISCIQRWPRTNNIMHSLLRTASLHISCVLKRSGIYGNESGSVRTASLHISYVLRCPDIVTIQLVMFIYALRVKWGLNFMDTKNFCVRSQDAKKFPVYPHNFSVSFFLSSGTHQSHHLDGCQAMDKRSSFIEAFWAFHFL